VAPFEFLPRTADDYATVPAAAVLTSTKQENHQRRADRAASAPPICATAAEVVLRGHRSAPRLRGGRRKGQSGSIRSDFRGSAAYKKDMAAAVWRAQAPGGIRQQARELCAEEDNRRKQRR
jgi:hypothetical protein